MKIEEPKTPDLKQMVEDIKVATPPKTERITSDEIKNTLKTQQEYALNSGMENTLKLKDEKRYWECKGGENCQCCPKHGEYDFAENANKERWYETIGANIAGLALGTIGLMVGVWLLVAIVDILMGK